MDQSIVNHCSLLKSTHAARNTICDDMENMYRMENDEFDRIKKEYPNTKLTISPRPRIAARGVVRLMTATEPHFDIAHDKNNRQAQKASDLIEKAAACMWATAGRMVGKPLEVDVAMALTLFSEVHIAVTRTADMAQYAKGKGAKTARRLEKLSKQTPYLFDVWDPRTGYPEFGPFGLSAYYREVETTAGAVMDEFGEQSTINLERTSKVTLSSYWDLEKRYVWVWGYDSTPLVEEELGLATIPIAVQVADGSRMFVNPEDQREPFLYTLWKSGFFLRETLSLTTMYTMIAALGSNPMFLARLQDPEQPLRIDHDVPGAIIKLRNTESFDPLLKAVIDPSVMTGLATAAQFSEESTIYGQTLGAPLGPNATFSETALLAQAGRLPLVHIQRAASWAIADAMRIALDWYRDSGGSAAKMNYKGSPLELRPSDVPDYYDLECRVELDLPQDRLQQMNLARMATEGDRPLASQRWAREEILGISQSDSMQKEIWDEQAAALTSGQYFQQMMALMQQQPNPQAGQPPVPAMPPQDMGGLPPEMAGQLPEQAPGMMPGMQPGQEELPGMPPEGMGYGAQPA